MQNVYDYIMLKNDEACFSDVVDICRKIGLHDYISSLPEKYNTVVDEVGSVFSSGQKQRLCLARSLLMDTSMFLLDEATSDLDIFTEKIVVELIRQKAEKSIVMMITHRDLPIKFCKEIFYFTSTGIAFRGTYEELKCNEELCLCYS